MYMITFEYLTGSQAFHEAANFMQFGYAVKLGRNTGEPWKVTVFM